MMLATTAASILPFFTGLFFTVVILVWNNINGDWVNDFLKVLDKSTNIGLLNSD